MNVTPMPYTVHLSSLHENQHRFLVRDHPEQKNQKQVVISHSWNNPDPSGKKDYRKIKHDCETQLVNVSEQDELFAYHIMFGGPGTNELKPTNMRIVAAINPLFSTGRNLSCAFNLILRRFSREKEQMEAPRLCFWCLKDSLEEKDHKNAQLTAINTFGPRFLHLLSEGTFNIPFMCFRVIQERFTAQRNRFDQSYEYLWGDECKNLGIGKVSYHGETEHDENLTNAFDEVIHS